MILGMSCSESAGFPPAFDPAIIVVQSEVQGTGNLLDAERRIALEQARVEDQSMDVVELTKLFPRADQVSEWF